MRDQLAFARLRVPVVGAAFGDGPPRLEWSDADTPSRTVAVDNLLWDLQRLGRDEAPNEQIILTARKYGPLRIRRCGIPGTALAEDVLTAADRPWEDLETQIAWADARLGVNRLEPLPGYGTFEDDPSAGFFVDGTDQARWEPLAAHRAYGRVLRAALRIGADLVAGKGVTLSMFADTWSPAVRLPPIVPSQEGLPPAPRRFAPANPMDWQVPEYALAWWKEIDLSLTASENRPLTLRRAFSWTLDSLATSAGLRIHAIWPEASIENQQATATTSAHEKRRPALTYALAPIPLPQYPTDVPVQVSEIEWSVWAVAVAQLHAAVCSTPGWVECDVCGMMFPIGDTKRGPRLGEPAYCGDACRTDAKNLRRRSISANKLRSPRAR